MRADITRAAREIELKSPLRRDAPALQPKARLEPVTRRYRPESAALDELVDVLYQLLVEAPADPPAVGSAAAELPCFPAAHK